MAQKEKQLENAVRLAASKDGHRLFRVNAGRAWSGAVLKHEGKTLILKNPRVFHGLPTGTPDLAGFCTVEVTPEMVGKKLPVFCAVELKTKNVVTTKEQKKAIAGVKRAGGISGVAKSVADWMEILDDWKRKFKGRLSK